MATKQVQSFADRHREAIRIERRGRCRLKQHLAASVVLLLSEISQEWMRKYESAEYAGSAPELELRARNERAEATRAIGLIRQIAGRLCQTFETERLVRLEPLIIGNTATKGDE